MSSADTHKDSEPELKPARSEQYYWDVVNVCRSQERVTDRSSKPPVGRRCTLQSGQASIHEIIAFPKIFSLPRPAGTAEGEVDDQPFKLEGIRKKDFERFLRAMFPDPDP
jgi:hypothetical protein